MVEPLRCSDLQTSSVGIANIGGPRARSLQPRIPHRREITATEPRLIANGIANIGLVRTLIAIDGQENGSFSCPDETLPEVGLKPPSRLQRGAISIGGLHAPAA
jgi:hypothetical protein